MRYPRCAWVFALCLLGPPLATAKPLVPAGGTITLADYRFADGESLPKLDLHYLTLGTPARDGAGRITNAVLLLHGTTGSAKNFLSPSFADALYGRGQPLDLADFFLVIPDGIGAGESSKPSDGLRTRFPHYGYRDQVATQHELLKRLGIEHVRLVLGTSMGGMQAWLWAETWPDDADAFVPIAATPAAISGRNMVWRQMIIQAIRDDPGWKGGDYPKDAPPHDWVRTAMPLFSIMTTNATTMQKEVPTRTAAADFIGKTEKRGTTLDADDFLYTFESSYDYDPAPRVGAITKPVLTINFADDLLNPPELLQLPETANFDKVMLPAGHGSFGHQTLVHAEAWAPALASFLATLHGSR